MDARALISSLQARGFTLTPTEGSLAVSPSKLLTDADRKTIRQHKAELLAFLKADRPALSLAAREVLRRVEVGNETPCCGVRFAIAGTVRVCPGCGLRWPNEDLRALRVYLEQKREGVKA